MSSWLTDAKSFFPEVFARNAMVPVFTHEMKAIGRVGDDAVNGVGRHCSHGFEAITLDYFLCRSLEHFEGIGVVLERPLLLSAFRVLLGEHHCDLFGRIFVYQAKLTLMHFFLLRLTNIALD